ncbi:MAG TPA: hypothetical protein VIW46_06160 [Acidimicrobiia bacterium]|jgi:hypothetical protein
MPRSGRLTTSMTMLAVALRQDRGLISGIFTADDAVVVSDTAHRSARRGPEIMRHGYEIHRRVFGG